MNQKIVSFSSFSFCIQRLFDDLYFFSPVSTFWRGLSSDLTAFQGTVCQNWQSNRLYGWHPWGWASLCPQCVWQCWAALLRLVNWQPCVRLLIREFPLGLRTGPGKLREKNTCQSLFTTCFHGIVFSYVDDGLKRTFSKSFFTNERQSRRNWIFAYGRELPLIDAGRLMPARLMPTSLMPVPIDAREARLMPVPIDARLSWCQLSLLMPIPIDASPFRSWSLLMPVPFEAQKSYSCQTLLMPVPFDARPFWCPPVPFDVSPLWCPFLINGLEIEPILPNLT